MRGIVWNKLVERETRGHGDGQMGGQVLDIFEDKWMDLV